VDSAPKPPSKPSLDLGGPSDTTTKTQEGAPTAPVVINKGSANTFQEPRADGGERTEATMKSLEAQATKSRDFTPKAAADPQTEAIRPKILKPEVRGSATPARPVERSFKDYRDLRNYALGK
jgi:hypothetical protein